MINERQCDICGMIEPVPWFEQPMNETIRNYSREYVSPVKMFYRDLDEALNIWGRTMLVEMDKGMLSALIKGCDPAYEIMDHPWIKSKGYYVGGHNDRWNWNHSFGDCTEEQLWETYQLLITPIPKKETWYQQQIREIKAVLLDGQDRSNQGQVDACLLEIERLEKLM